MLTCNKNGVKSVLSIASMAGMVAFARSQAVVTPLEVPEDERAFLLAVQKPTILGAVDAGAPSTDYPNGLMTTEIGFKTGPNAFPYPYTVKCYPIEEASPGVLSPAPTCSELPSLTQVGATQSGNLPLRFSKVDVSYPVGGLDAPGVDCFVTVSGPSGKNSKCSYAGRAIAPDVETIRCLGSEAGDTFWVNGREITVVENSPGRYTADYDDPNDDSFDSPSYFEYYVWGPTVNDLVDVGEAGALGINWDKLPNICTSNVRDMAYSFAGVLFNRFGEVDGSVNANHTITQWDTQSVVTMSSMFSGAIYFDQPIGSWNTSSVGPTDTPPCDPQVDEACFLNDMYGMFQEAEAFNADIGSWDVSSVTDMQAMFDGALSFNQDISGWETGSVEFMFAVFRNAESFNQNIDTNGDAWDVSSVTDMTEMFKGAISFNQNLTNWEPNFSSTDGSECSEFAAGATAWLDYWTAANPGATYPLDTNPPLSQKLLTAGCGQEQ